MRQRASERISLAEKLEIAKIPGKVFDLLTSMVSIEVQLMTNNFLLQKGNSQNSVIKLNLRSV